jgi:2-polyprenyl-6-hydroxyphenyl methylase/3-demethylubiquinone-9 3-methyltransferase
MLYKDKKRAAFSKGDLNSSTLDPDEIARFDKLAEEWWKPDGAYKVVHAFNAARIEKLTNTLPSIVGRDREAEKPLAGLSLLDVGCGAGIVSEPMARLGAAVTAIDASERSVLIARQHAVSAGLQIDYQNALPEDIAQTGQKFDLVMSLEVIEHVADPSAFLEILGTLVKPGGALVIGTINRTVLSYVKAIIGAEYILRWLPKGTHSWSKFVRPSELNDALLPRGFHVEECCGVDLNLFTQKWSTTRGMKSTYLQFYKLRIA